MTHSFLPKLLFRHTLYFSFVLGAAAHLWPPSWLFLLFLLGADVRCRGWPRLGIVLLASIAGFCCAYFAKPPLPSEAEWIQHKKVLLEANIDEVSGKYGERLHIILSNIKANGKKLDGKLQWTWQQPTTRPAAGGKISLLATVKPFKGFRNDEQNSVSSQWREGIFWRMWTGGPVPTLRFQPPAEESILQSFKYRTSCIRETWRAAFEQALRRAAGDKYGWGILPALVFGDRFHISITDLDRLTKAGLTHSIALSGQHLCIAVLLAGIMLKVIGFACPTLFLAVPRQTLLPTVALPLAGAYLWLGMAPTSLCRAVLMLACWATFRWLKRPASLFDALLTTLACMTLFSPSLPGEIGALLSFSSVAGIMVLVPLLQKLPFFPKSTKTSLIQKGLQLILSLLACTAATMLATLPVVLTIFGCIPPLAFLTNLLWLPVLAFWVMPLSFAALPVAIADIQFLADPLLKLASLPCQLLLTLLEKLDNAGFLENLWLPKPHWTFCLGWTIILLFAAWNMDRKGKVSRRCKTLLAAGVALLLYGPILWLSNGFQQDIHLRVLDVGQGQAVLVQGPGHFRLLMDGGGIRASSMDTGKDVIRPVIANNAPLALDVLALSHPDTDHLRGLLFFSRHASIGCVLVAEGLSEAQKEQPDYQRFLKELERRGIPVRRLGPGDRMSLPHDLSLDVPTGSVPHGKNDGLILRLSRNGHGLVLIPGDEEKKTLDAIVKSSADLSADVLIAPHHGSKRNISKTFIYSVNPNLVLASCGPFNQWDFPSQELKDLLGRHGIPLHATSISGELHLLWPKSNKHRWYKDAEPQVLR